jgi:bifunctional non-homologous end joining protein LigD
VANLPLDVILDGECIGDGFYAFDVLLIGKDDLRGHRYGERYLRLMNLLASFQHRHIQLALTSFTAKQKHQMFEDLKKANGEGVVFKQIDAPYTAGRPATGGPQLKFKFVTTASFIVGKINAKRSIGLLLFDGDKIKSAGNVTIPTNHEIPAPGWVVECRYLYAHKESGSIFQPLYLGVREDIPSEECTVGQLKFKAEASEVAA